jgi:hypothetical protein
MRLLPLAALALTFVGAGTLQAQAEKQSVPAVELRLRSVHELLDKAEFVGGLAGKDDIVKSVKAILKTMTKEKTGLIGIDPKKPIGFYADLSVDVVNSPGVLMIPITDKDTFLKFLADREITTEPGKEGTTKVFVPVVSELHMRFTNDYLYVGRSVKDLDVKVLPTPKAFFAKDDPAFASLIVRFDRIPDDVKKVIIGQVELNVAEQRRQNGMKEDPVEKAVLNFLGDVLSGGVQTFFDDARELKARVVVDETGEELAAEVTLTAKPGSTLAKNISSLGGQTSLPAAITMTKAPAVRATAKAGLPPELKKRFAKMLDDLSKEIEEKAEPTAKEVVRNGLEALLPTFKAGETDTAITLTAPDAKGKYNLILATAVKKGKDIEKLLKDLSGFAGAVADFNFDVEKIGEFSLHKIVVTAAPPEVEEVFGTSTFWLAVSDNYIALSLEPDGTLIRSGLKAKAASVPALSVELSSSGLLPLVGRELKPDERKAVMKDAFGDGNVAGKDTISVSITGGDMLSLKVNAKGKAVRMFFALGEFKR